MSLATDRYLSVNGVRLHLLDWGNPGQPALVLLHSVRTHAHSWDALAAAVRDRFHVVAPDLRGFGESEWSPGGHYGVEVWAEDLDTLIDQMGLGPVALMGGSTGGRVAMAYAGMRPDKVRALVIEDVGPERPPEVIARLREGMAQHEPFASLEEAARRIMAANPRRSLLAALHEVTHGVKELDDGRVVWRHDPALAASFGEVDLWPYLERIICPTLIVRGAETRILSEEMAQRMREAIGPERTQTVTVPDAGHNVCADNLEEFLKVVGEFLEGV